MKGVDVSHLEAGMRVTLVYRRDGHPGGDRLSATLANYNGALWTEGGVLVRMTDGCAGPGVLEVLDPLPPVKLEPLPIGTRKRSPNGVEVILTDDGDDMPWRVYQQAEDGTKFLTDAEVADWETITDAPKAAIDADELAARILRAMLDWSMSLGYTDPAVTERIRVGHREVIADAIRAALPESAT